MEKPKKYEITNFDQLLNVVTVENYERLSVDLMLWLYSYAMTIEQIRKEMPEKVEGKTNAEIAKAEFIWIDDGKHDMSVTVKNTSTGEIHDVK